jgi:hypothetical protein
MNSQVKCAFVIFSDLHLGQSLLKDAEVRFDQPEWAKKLIRADTGIQAFFRWNCAPHSDALVKRLRSALNTILVGLQKKEFDLYLILGDQVTWPDDASFDFASQLFWGPKRITDEYMGGETSCYCLCIPKDRVVLIPGNHDKLLRQDLKQYSKFLGQTPHKRECYFVSKHIGGQDFLFAALDASRYTKEKNCTFDVICSDCRGSLAAGEIDDRLMKQMRDKLRLLRSGQQVDGARLTNYDAAIKILMIHYALNESRLDRWSPTELVVPMKCTGAELLAEFSSDFTFAIHGHRHKPTLYEFTGRSARSKADRGLPVISVGSTTQRSPGYKRLSDAKGFYVVTFLEAGEIHAQHYCWSSKDNHFVQDPAVRRSGFLVPSKVRKVG